MEFTILESVLIMAIWIIYGLFHSWQYKWFEFYKGYNNLTDQIVFTIFVIVFAPIALCIRIIRGVFFWKGEY